MEYQVRCARLPLAIYREVAAHLRQVNGVKVEFVPQRSQQFDYTQSQIDSLWIQYAEESPANVRERVQQILAYYGDRYGTWEIVNSPNNIGLNF